MADLPRTKFNSPWTVANIEAALNDVSSAKGSSESLTAALNAMRAEINSLSGGVHLKGAVDYYSDLPASPSEGDAYTVRYQGTSGTDPLGIEYAWATYQGTPQWIPIGVDPSVFAKQSEINVVANAGAKNLLKVSAPDAKANVGNTGFTWSGNTASKNHVSFEIKDDLTVYVKSDTGYTASDVTIFYLTDGSCAYPNTILNGCPSGGSNTTYELRTATPVKSDYGSGVEITSDSATNVVIIIRSGWSGELTFRPMIRPAAITDPTFQPYAKTNRELTVLTDEDRASLIELVDGGAKNHCTLASGSNTPPARWINIPVSDVGVGQWVMSFGTLTSTDTDDTFCQAICFNSSDQQVSNWVNFKRESNTNKIFTTTDDVSYVRLYSANSYATSEGDTVTFNNAMMCSKAAWDVSHAYQPYRPSWQEMWDAIQALESGGNRALTKQTEPEEQEER